MTTGLKQGDVLSPMLFNLVLEKVVREMNISEGIALEHLEVGLLAYADDVAIIGEDMKTVKNLCKKLMVAAIRVGLIINDEKT